MSEYGVVVALLLLLVKSIMYLKHVAEGLSMTDKLVLPERLNSNVVTEYNKVLKMQAQAQTWMILSEITIIELIENFRLLELQDFW